MSIETDSDADTQPADAAEGLPPYRYTAALADAIERRWQDRWETEGTFHAPNPGQPGSERPKFYLLDMFPYPSGAGLHVGHPLGYIATDVLGRYLRMTGHNVLHAMGYDAFGLPAEQHAVQTGTHPRTTTEANIARYRAQLRRLGLAHDDRRSVATTDPGYYRWTQWIFLTIYNSWYDAEQRRARPITDLIAQLEAGIRPTPDGRPWRDLSELDKRRVIDSFRLAYVSDAPVNWCPGLGTVLANEEVSSDGRSERGNFPVFRRRLQQWMMRITAYADRLLDDLDRLDWPEPIMIMQRNWIGRSDGARIRFAVTGATDSTIEVFTTRPDTLFGASYLVLAPEHPLVEVITAASWPPGTDPRWTGRAPNPAGAVADYRAAAAAKSELDRQTNRNKTGVFTGATAVNPATGQAIPIFVADYVLMGYGTGAIMAVPGQDQRDWDFAEAFGLPVIRTTAPPAGFDDEAFTGEGPAINSANDEVSLDGLAVVEAKRVITDWLINTGAGVPEVQYKLRDWLFSRQRYWGEPFPVVWDEHGPRPLPASELPVLLPEVTDYAPRTYDPDDAGSEPEPPLAGATEWVEVDLDLGEGSRTYRREANTMPQWAGSCWYYLRYLDPANEQRFVGADAERYWLAKDPHRPGDAGGVDLYVGGVEHAVLHLLYARFWHKVLYDLGEVSSEEPFRRLVNQGYIQAYAYTDPRGTYVPAEQITEQPDGTFRWGDTPVTRTYGKMGKSLRNVVTPDEICERCGADTFRLYEMSTGPLEVSRPWSTRDVVGSYRFLQRVWRLLVDEQTGTTRLGDGEPDEATLRVLHRTLAGVHADLRALRGNTAVAKIIELNNQLIKTYGKKGVPRLVAEPLVLMLAPLCPHVAEELWSRLGHDTSLAYRRFPEADERWLKTETVDYLVQLNGKLRTRVTVPAGADAETVRTAALATERIVTLLAGRAPRRVIVVPDRLINIVV
jgi:leucyl-tRNA synthetase